MVIFVIFHLEHTIPSKIFNSSINLFIFFQYKLPEAELEMLLTADSEDAQRSVLENFAKDLPIVTR